MTILIAIVLLAFGLLVTAKAADYLVDGASSVAKKFNIPSLVIGLTIVAFGTSAPELIVSITAAIQGSTDIALGNVVGSNIFNILFILGLCSMITNLAVQSSTVWKEIPFSLLAAFVTLVLGATIPINDGNLLNLNYNSTEKIGYIGLAQGLILLFFFAIFLYYTFTLAKNGSADKSDQIKPIPNWKSILSIVGGLAGLLIGGRLVVDNAVQIAAFLGLSEKFIGLTIVAAGTSLPELMTSLRAAQKGEADIAVGNIVGSNLFNIFFILGLTATIKQIPIDAQNIFDLIVLVVTTVLLFLVNFLFKRFNLGKIEGVAFLISYIAYVAYLINR